MAKDEELGYVSTSPFSGTPIETKPQDEVDLPAIKRIQSILQSQIDSYSSVKTLTVDETTFTIKQQLAVNQMMIMHLQELQSITEKTINDIREKYNG